MPARFPDEQRIPAWKISFFQYLVASTVFVLLIGYWRLQIVGHHYYQEQAERNRTRNLPVIAPRGRILDREGRVLADNFPAFSVLLLREGPAPLLPERVHGIARGLQIEPVELQDL